MKRTVAVFALALALSAIAFAHGNEKHVMGHGYQHLPQLHYRGDYVK
jgi:hypothetical protein